MADPRAFEDVPPRMTGREFAGLLLTLIGAVGLIVGVCLLDWRAGIATAGGVLLVLGILLGMV